MPNMISWADFTATMNDILSSGDTSELSGWHQEQLTELLDKVHDNDVGTFLNRYYADVAPSEVIPGELEFIAAHIDCKVVYQISFSK